MAECGLKEGRVVGLIKKAIEDAILDEKIDNTYEAAFAYFMEIKDRIISDNINGLPSVGRGS